MKFLNRKRMFGKGILRKEMVRKGIVGTVKKKLPKKGAISLSINTLVIIIIALVIFGFGISFLYKLMSSSEEIKADLDQRTEQELLRLLVDQGKKVALPLSTATLTPGNDHIFGLGILNIGDGEETFWFTVELSKFTDETKEDRTEDVKEDTKNWLLFNPGNIEIEEQEHHKEGILVDVPGNALKGQYIFNARVYHYNEQGEETQYGNTQKFVVVVK